MNSIPGKYRPLSIATAMLGVGLVVHGFVRLYNLQSVATAARFQLFEVPLGTLLMCASSIFLVRYDQTRKAPRLSSRLRVSLFICTGTAIVLGFLVLHAVCSHCS